MQGRQHDSSDHQRNRHPLQDPQSRAEDGVPKERVLQNHRRELQGEHSQVEDHARGNLEEHRVVLPVDHGVPDVPRQTQVVEEPHGHRDVSQEGRENRRAGARLVLLQPEDVDRGRYHEATGGQRNSGHHVESDPQPPGSLVGQIRYGAEPMGEAHDRDGRQHTHRRPQKRLQDRKSIKHRLLRSLPCPRWGHLRPERLPGLRSSPASRASCGG